MENNNEGLKKALKQAIKGLIEPAEYEEIGLVNPDVLAQLVELEDQHELQHQELRRKIEEFKAEIEAAHTPECTARKAKLNELWKVAMDQVGVPEKERQDDFIINRHTGIVSKLKNGEG